MAEQHKDRYTHFLVSRKLCTFEEFGRRENHEQSEALHLKTLEILERLGLNYTVINRYDDHIPLQSLASMGAIYKGPQLTATEKNEANYQPTKEITL